MLPPHALRDGCTPAAASQQLAALERQTGVPLLERGARSVRLTEAGPVVAFGTAAGFTVPALAAFRRHHPGVELSFVELEPDDAVPAVRAGEADLAVTHQYARLPKPDLRGLRQTPLRSERLLLAVPPSLRPSGEGAVPLRDFAAATGISPRPSSGFQALVELTCRAAGFEPRVGFRTDSYDVMLTLVASDFGVALVPELAAHERQGVTYAEIARPARLAREVHATTRAADSSPAAGHLLDLLVERVSSGPGPGRPPRRRG